MSLLLLVNVKLQLVTKQSASLMDDLLPGYSVFLIVEVTEKIHHVITESGQVNTNGLRHSDTALQAVNEWYFCRSVTWAESTPYRESPVLYCLLHNITE